jgi:hypothetical protein
MEQHVQFAFIQAVQSSDAPVQSNVAFYGFVAVLLVVVALLIRAAMAANDDDSAES